MDDGISAHDEWLAPPETAAVVKLSVQTLANRRTKGTGPPFIKLSPGKGGRIRYRRRDVDAWLEARVEAAQ